MAWLPWIILIAVGLTAMTIGALAICGWFSSAAQVSRAFTTPVPGAGTGHGAGGNGETTANGRVAAPVSEPARRRAETTASGPSRHSDRQALAYFDWRWGADDAAVRRITDIRTIGGYLRIYTDLPESAGNSGPAITLCKRGVEYLADRLGETDPVVFVQAEFGENGTPVLANILGPGDRSCRVTHPAPKG